MTSKAAGAEAAQQPCITNGQYNFAHIASRSPEVAALLETRRLKRGGPETSATRPAEVYVNLRDGAAARAVVAAVLRAEYDVEWSLPAANLCPPVPNRLAYVEWVKRLCCDGHGGSGVSVGLDIGTGASLIYPILCVAHAGVEKMYGSDVDAESLRHAAALIRANPRTLGSRVVLLDVKEAAESDAAAGCVLIPALREIARRRRAASHDESDVELVSFCLCNPPFYESPSAPCPHDAPSPPAAKRRKEGGSVTALTEGENATQGGEYAFVKAMVDESLLLRAGTVRWCTSMLGRKESLKRLRKHLVALGARVTYRTTEFTLGSTTRWLLAWRVLTDPAEPIVLLPPATSAGDADTDSDADTDTESHAFPTQGGSPPPWVPPTSDDGDTDDAEV